MRIAIFVLFALIPILPLFAQVKLSDHRWIAVSNDFTNQLLKVELKHHPEQGSRQGLREYDELVSQPTRADEDQERKEAEDVVAKLKAALPEQRQKEIVQDLEIILRRAQLQFRMEDFERAHQVPFVNASMHVFLGLRILLDEQTPAERRPSAVVRIRRYAGLDPGYRAGLRRQIDVGRL